MFSSLIPLFKNKNKNKSLVLYFFISPQIFVHINLTHFYFNIMNNPSTSFKVKEKNISRDKTNQVRKDLSESTPFSNCLR